MSIPFEEVVLGCVLLGATLGASAIAGGLLVWRRMPELRGAVRAAAVGLVVSIAVLAVHVVPLTLGIMSRATVLATALVLLVAASRLPVNASGARPAPAVPPGAWSARLIAGVGLAALGLYVVAFVIARASDPIGSVDSLSFHLPHTARWIDSGSLWAIDSFVPGWAFGHYPNNGDIFQLAAILPWDNDALVRFVTYPFAGLALVAMYATAVELGAQRAVALTFSVLGVALPITMAMTLDYALTDAAALAGVATGVLFGVRHARTGARADLVLGAAGLGLALGTKWYGLSNAIALVAVWAVARVAARHGLRRVTADTALAGGVMLATGGVWLVRNLVLSGNPVFPVKVAPMGVTVFDAPPDPIRETYGFALTHYAGDLDLWRSVILDQLAASFGLAGAVLLAVAVASIVLAARGRRPDPRVVTLGVGALVLTALYAATPYSAVGPDGAPLVRTAARYGTPALTLAIPLAAWLATRLPRAALAIQLAGLGFLLEAMSRYDEATLPSVRSAGEVRPVAAAVTLAGVVGVALAVGRRGTWSALSRTWRISTATALGLAAAAVAVVAADRAQESFNRDRYVSVDRAYAWLNANAPSGARVGISGDWPVDPYPPPWPAFGPRLGNEVEYVGPTVRERLERYASAGPYTAALRAGAYDIVLVGLAPGTDRRVPELAWTRAAGYSEVTRSARVALLRR